MTVDAPTITGAPLWRRATAEFLGTGLLVTIVVGSGIAAQNLSTDTGLQLLENSLTTALGLGVLILLLAPISEAHFNPVVSLVDFTLGRRGRTGLTGGALAAYLAAQISGQSCISCNCARRRMIVDLARKFGVYGPALGLHARCWPLEPGWGEAVGVGA